MKMEGWRWKVLLLWVSMLSGCSGESVPALFVFGDSLLDTGNNNGLATYARAATPPYGSDFHNNNNNVSSGRFSNGPITTDFIAASLNVACPPPFVSAGENIEHGVNFASAGSGILDSTGSFFGEHYSMGAQISKFEEVKKRLEGRFGREKSGEMISKAVFYITTGSNDYLVTYYALPPTSLYALYSPLRFRQLLLSNLSQQLQSLYDLGARKLAVTAIPNIGCTPYALRVYGVREKDEINCVKFMNDAAKAYNAEFFRVIRRLQARHPDAHFISNNGFEASLLPYQNPTAY
ncbi:hypothetical protein KI387_013270, partial [Taxus chinensis]